MKLEAKVFSLAPLKGLPDNDHRGLVFLECTSEDVNALHTFRKFETNLRFQFFNRFQHWRDGLVRDEYHHGWNTEDKKCFYVFKCRRGTARHRIYGILIHPLPKTKPRFQLCMLVVHTTKFEQDTDPSMIKLLNQMSTDLALKKAVGKKFPDLTKNQKEIEQRTGNGKQKRLDRRK